MAYSRPRRSLASEDDGGYLTMRTRRGNDAPSAAADMQDSEDAPLAPPKPRFLATRTGSVDSSDGSGDDSDRDSPPSPGSASGGAGTGNTPPTTFGRQRNHRRRTSMQNSYSALDAPQDPTPAAQDPYMRDPYDPYSSSAIYMEPRNTDSPRGNRRPPPSSYPFPFQAYPGNPDPGMAIPGMSRRSSVESFASQQSRQEPAMPLVTAGPGGTSYYQPPAQMHGTYGQVAQSSPSAGEFSQGDLGRHMPYASTPEPYVSQSRRTSIHDASGPQAVYTQSAAGGIIASPANGQHGHYELPRSASVQTFRAPFLSPASRPSSTIWTPPTFPYATGAASGSRSGTPIGAGGFASGSVLALGLSKRAPMPSARLPSKLTAAEKPWLNEREHGVRASRWITRGCILLGVAAAGFLCYRALGSVDLIPDSRLCNEWSADFSGGLDTSNDWNQVAELGGFGNGEFQMTTSSSNNVYTSNGELYLLPTLSADDPDIGGYDNLFSGSTYKLPGCTSSNSTACHVTPGNGVVINPVQAARITTQGKHTVKYGRVEVEAKLPTGDWLWPAIWMMPNDDSVYGTWPLGGEIDIMEARGNGPAYPAQGNNVARSSLNYGPLPGTQARIFGWQSYKRTTLAAGFHTYALEWDEDFIRMYVDSRIAATLHLSTRKKSMWQIGNFPATAKNGSGEVAVEDPWTSGSRMAPFDQDFYLIIDLAAGGTSGWFPDGYGGKPWLDGSNSAMYDFAKDQDTWHGTWPSNPDDLAFRIKSVKMWSLC